jgi:phenylacetate-CoA ligase
MRDAQRARGGGVPGPLGPSDTTFGIGSGPMSHRAQPATGGPAVKEATYCWNPEVELMGAAELRALQSQRLRDVVQRVYARVPHYREKFDAAGVRPEQIRDLEDITRLPFTTKADLRDTYPFGMFAAPMEEVVRIHASSGTTGKATVVGYTRYDVDMWAEVMARTLAGGGAHRGDFVQNAYGYGLFTGGLGAHYGAEKLGASVIPTSGGQTKRQLQLMADFGTTVLCCTPSYALVIGEEGKEMGLDFGALPLRVGFFGAEPWTETMRREIEAVLHIDALDIYGLSEIIGPGVAFECLAKGGLHVNEDHFYPEVINPETGQPVPPGEPGELVFTTLTKEALPLIRYRTRDLTRFILEPCPCGRGLRRMKRVTGRSDDMLIIRGVNVFPSQIEEVLMGIEGTTPNYLLVVDRKAHQMDELEVQVEVSERMFSDEIVRLETLTNAIRKAISGALGLSVTVRLVEPKRLERSLGKAKRVIDRRDLGA